MTDWEMLLASGAESLGIPLSAGQLEQFARYRALLLEWNEKMNLTAITDDAGIAVRHFLDSIVISRSLPENASVIDVGTGAGFPGVPLAIVRPDLSVTLLDSLNKRLVFLGELTGALGLAQVRTVHLRAEDGGRDDAYREQFDAAVSRAVAALPVLCELCLPYVRPGGTFYGYKGTAAEEELVAAKNAIGTLGGGEAQIVEAELPQSDYRHAVIMIKKVRPTSPKYPRTYKKITKNPIL